MWANRHKLKEEIKYLQRDYSKVKVQIDEIKVKKDKIDKEVQRLENQLFKSDQIINYLNGKLGQTQQKRKDLIAEVKKWQIDEIKITQELKNLSEKIKKEKKELKNYKNQKKSLTQEFKLIKEKVNNIELHLDDLIKEQDDLQKKINQDKEFLEQFNTLEMEWRDFVDSVRKGEIDIEKAKDGLKTMRTIDALYRSASSGETEDI